MKYSKQATKDRKQGFLNALVKTMGIVTTAASLVGVTRRTHYQWCRDDPEYSKAVDDLQNIALDFAETALHQQIKDGITSATIFYLKTKGRGRGYTEQIQITERRETVVQIANGGIPEWLEEPAEAQIIKIEQSNEQ